MATSHPTFTTIEAPIQIMELALQGRVKLLLVLLFIIRILQDLKRIRLGVIDHNNQIIVALIKILIIKITIMEGL